MSCTWDACEVFGLHNDEKCGITCVGTTQKLQRCTYTINKGDIAVAKAMCKTLPSYTDSDALIRQLHELAYRVLCVKVHREKQVDVVVKRWAKIIALIRAPSDTKPEYSTATDQAEMRRRSRNHTSTSYDFPKAHTNPGEFRFRGPELKDEFRSAYHSNHFAEQQRQAEARRKLEADRLQEAKRRAEAERERERQRQKAAEDAERRRAQEKIKQEETRRAQERAKQDDSRRQTRAETARKAAAEEAKGWQESWARHNQNMANYSRIDTSRLGEAIRDTIPWPVKTGKFQDVNKANIEAFFRHAPLGDSPDQQVFRRFVKQNIKKWHTDKVNKQFPGVKDNQEIMALLTMITQVLNDLIQEDRSTGLNS